MFNWIEEIKSSLGQGILKLGIQEFFDHCELSELSMMILVIIFEVACDEHPSTSKLKP